MKLNLSNRDEWRETYELSYTNPLVRVGDIVVCTEEHDSFSETCEPLGTNSHTVFIGDEGEIKSVDDNIPVVSWTGKHKKGYYSKGTQLYESKFPFKLKNTNK